MWPKEGTPTIDLLEGRHITAPGPPRVAHIARGEDSKPWDLAADDGKSASSAKGVAVKDVCPTEGGYRGEGPREAQLPTRPGR